MSTQQNTHNKIITGEFSKKKTPIHFWSTHVCCFLYIFCIILIFYIIAMHFIYFWGKSGSNNIQLLSPIYVSVSSLYKPLTFFPILFTLVFLCPSLSWVIWVLLLCLQIDGLADTTLSLHHYCLCNVMAVLWWLFSLGLSSAFWWHNTPCEPHQNINVVPTAVFHASQVWAMKLCTET